MEVHLSLDTEAQLSRIAAEQGRNADLLAQEVLGEYLKAEARFVQAVKAGEAALERGDVLSHAEVGARIARLMP